LLGINPEATGGPGFSGADLANLAARAAIVAVRGGREVLTGAGFDSARDRILLGRREGSNVLPPAEKHAVAVHEAGHALVAALCEHADPVAKVTILPAGQALGVTERAWMEYPSCASWRLTVNGPGLPAVRVRRRVLDKSAIVRAAGGGILLRAGGICAARKSPSVRQASVRALTQQGPHLSDLGGLRGDDGLGHRPGRSVLPVQPLRLRHLHGSLVMTDHHGEEEPIEGGPGSGHHLRHLAATHHARHGVVHSRHAAGHGCGNLLSPRPEPGTHAADLRPARREPTHR